MHYEEPTNHLIANEKMSEQAPVQKYYAELPYIHVGRMCLSYYQVTNVILE